MGIVFEFFKLLNSFICSPNYSGVLLGLNGMVGVSPGFISPYIVGILTFGNVRLLVECKVILN